MPGRSPATIRTVRSVALSALLVGAAGCGGLGVENECTTSPITVSLQTPIKVGQTVQAGADYATSNCPASTTVTWSSSNTAIASVTSDGRVTGAAVGGPVTIRAQVNEKSGTADVTVTAASIVP